MLWFYHESLAHAYRTSIVKALQIPPKQMIPGVLFCRIVTANYRKIVGSKLLRQLNILEFAAHDSLEMLIL